MTTVTRDFAEQVMRWNGFACEADKLQYEAQGGYHGGDNPRCTRIVEYTNAWGVKAYGLSFENENPERQRRYLTQSSYIRDPKVIWAYESPAVSRKEEKRALEQELNAEGRPMVKAEDRRGIMFDLTNPFRMAIMVAQDGVWLHFYPTNASEQGLCVNVDAIGPQLKDSIIRKGLDQWVRDLEATCVTLQAQGHPDVGAMISAQSGGH